MRQSFSTVKENGCEYALSIAKELRGDGYEIISGPEETMVPRGEGSDGKPVMVPGYRIVVDDGRPSRTRIFTK